jgi:predicted DNA binding protein
MKQIEFSVSHDNCWGCDTTENFPDVIVNFERMVGLKPLKNTHSAEISIWRTIAPDENTLNGFLDAFSKHPRTLKLEVLSKNKNTARILVITRWEGMIMEKISKYNVWFDKGVEMSKGFDHFKVYADKGKGLGNMFSELREVGQLKVHSIKNIDKIISSDFEEIKSILTPKQFEALIVADKHGYYSWPRKANLSELAEKLKMSRQGFQDNLRAAETKILPAIIKKIKENT